MKNKFKKNYFEKELKFVWNYLKDSKNFIYLASLIFISFCFIGYFIPLPEKFAAELISYFEELIRKTEGFGIWEMICFLFENNLLVSFLSLIFGIFLGIIPLFNAAINGLILGFVSNMVVNESGISSLWKLLPHGIFELPALVISLGLGLRFGFFGLEFIERYLKIKNKNHRRIIAIAIIILSLNILLLIFSLFFLIFQIYTLLFSLFMILILLHFLLKDKIMKKNLIDLIKTFIFIVIPLLVIAAIIEGTLIIFGK